METRKRIAFVNPPSPIHGKIWIRDINRSGRYSPEGTLWPQVSLAMLASVFPEDKVIIYDCIAEKIGYKEIYEKLQNFKPDWVITNPVSSSFNHDMIVSMYAKSLGAKTVIISPHSKVLHDEVIRKFPFIDYTVDYSKDEKEEYEFKLRELINGIPAKGTSFEDIPPARQDLLPIEKYNLPFIGKSYTFLVVSRGCPHACNYCRATVQNERMPRFRPVSICIEEIKKYNLKNIALHSDIATMNRKWMVEFCEELLKLNFKVRWICNSRVDTVDPGLLKIMKKAGCWMICFGAESGDDKVLEASKKKATVYETKMAFKWAKEYGIKTWFYGMMGLYTDTKESMEKTINLAMEVDPDIANFSVTAPYFGTEFYRIASEKNWITDHKWESFDQSHSAIVEQPNCSRELVKQMQRRAYMRWYLSYRGLKFLLKGFRLEYLSYFIQTIKDHLRA